MEEEAKVVREIYDMFIAGKSTNAIAKSLMERGIKTPSGKTKWQTCTVYSILQNEKYKEAALLQKEFTTDFLTKKKKVNEGEVPQYYVENSHPAIVDPAVWELAQIELGRRGHLGKAYSCSGIFSGRIFCGDCGALFGPRRWTTRSGESRSVWRCGKKYGNGNSCDSPIVEECDLKQKFVDAFNEIYSDRDFVLETCRDLLEQFDDTEEIDAQIEEHLRECEIIAELNKKLLDENANVVMDQDNFMRKYNGYVEKYEEESAQAEKLQKIRNERKKKSEMISAFMFEIHEREGLLERFDEKLWLTTIESVQVKHDGSLVFKFNSGMEVTK